MRMPSLQNRFQSTLLMRGATPDASSVSFATYFNPRSSCEERPQLTETQALRPEFQSTLLMRGATPAPQPERPECQISIHAPHARSDGIRQGGLGGVSISIHAPHARSDEGDGEGGIVMTFQSTLLMRGATRGRRSRSSSHPNFNPRSSCEERLPDDEEVGPPVVISIHAPHARSDP